MMQAFLSWYNGLTDTLTGSLILFAVGLVLLIKGGDWFVDSATGIAKRFHLLPLPQRLGDPLDMSPFLLSTTQGNPPCFFGPEFPSPERPPWDAFLLQTAFAWALRQPR